MDLLKHNFGDHPHCPHATIRMCKKEAHPKPKTQYYERQEQSVRSFQPPAEFACSRVCPPHQDQRSTTIFFIEDASSTDEFFSRVSDVTRSRRPDIFWLQTSPGDVHPWLQMSSQKSHYRLHLSEKKTDFFSTKISKTEILSTFMVSICYDRQTLV